MPTLAHSVYLDSEFGVPQDLPKAGTALENPYAFDSAARELKDMADRGLVEILSEHSLADASDELIDQLSFKRVR